jgi:hypothetical protein
MKKFIVILLLVLISVNIYGARSFSSLQVNYNKKGLSVKKQEILFLYEPDYTIRYNGYYILYTHYTDKKKVIFNKMQWVNFYVNVMLYYSYYNDNIIPDITFEIGDVHAKYNGNKIKVKMYLFRENKSHKYLDKSLMIDIPGVGIFYYGGGINMDQLSKVFSPKKIGQIDAQLRKEYINK